MSVNLRNITERQDLELLEKDNPELAALFAVYPPEAAKILLNNKTKLKKVCNLLSNSTQVSTINAVIMTCQETCPFKDVCVLIKNGLAPFNYPCPIEKKIIIEMEADIVQHLEIDRNNPIEMEMLWDLIDAKLLDMRASGALKSGILTQTITQKVGQAIVTRQEIAPEILIKIDLKRIKSSIMDAFVSTRRAKKRYGMNNDTSTLEQLILNAANNVTNTNDQ